MDCSMPGFPVPHHLPEFAQVHVYWIGDAIQTISSSVAAFFSYPQSFPASGSFPMSWLFALDGQSIGASASVLPMDIQGWFHLRLTGLISLQFKELSRVFSSITIQKHQFFSITLLYGLTLTSIYDYWKNHSFAKWTFVKKVMSLLFNTLKRSFFHISC